MKNIFLLILACVPLIGHAETTQSKTPPAPAGKTPPPSKDKEAKDGKDGKDKDAKSADGKDKDAKKGPMKFPKYHPLSPENPYRASAFGDDLCPHVWSISTG